MPTRHPFRKLAAIYIGGIIGALIRVGLSEAFPHAADAWPWPTFAVNVFGAFLIGYFVTALSSKGPKRLHHPFLATGICGTLTTFSAMQLELYNMVEASETGLALAYLTVSLGCGFVALQAGLMSGRRNPQVQG